VREWNDRSLAPTSDAGNPWCVVVGLRVDSRSFGAITFVTDETHPGFGPFEIRAAEEIATTTSKALERLQLRREARESVRRTQHIASQLHQTHCGLVHVNSLTNELDIATSVAMSAQSVFGADGAMVSLEADRVTPTRVIVERGRSADERQRRECVEFRLPAHLSPRHDSPVDGTRLARCPGARAPRSGPRSSGDSPADPARPFSAEDVEVLTLLAQTASTAFGAAEMSRTILNSRSSLAGPRGNGRPWVLSKLTPGSRVQVVESRRQQNIRVARVHRRRRESSNRAFPRPLGNRCAHSGPTYFMAPTHRS